MKNYQISLLLLLVLLIISCSKDTLVTPSPTDKVCLVQKAIYTDTTYDEYTYDNLYRLIKKVSFQNTIKNEFTYTYNGNIATVSNEGIPFRNIYLNEMGFADSIVDFIPNFVDLKQIRKYNSNWEVVSLSITGVGYGQATEEKRLYEYKDGNLVKELVSDRAKTSATFTIDYEYYLDKLDSSKKSFEIINFANKSVNLRKKVTDNFGAITNYNYDFDEKGKVIKSIGVISGNQSRTLTTNYNWICK